MILENSCPKTSTVVSESSPLPDFSLQDEEMEELLTVILLYVCLHGVMFSHMIVRVTIMNLKIQIKKS